jgi:hypothetical protein
LDDIALPLWSGSSQNVQKMGLDPGLLIRQYFDQLSIGCDSGDCQQPTCRACAKFSLDFPNANQVACQAIRMAIRHPVDPKLCPNIRFANMWEMRNVTSIATFNSTVMAIVRGDKAMLSSRAGILRPLQAIFTDRSSLPFVLMASDRPLNLKNLSVAFNEQSSAMSSAPSRSTSVSWA